MSNEGLSQRGAEFQLQPAPTSKRKRSTAINERPRLWPAPVQAVAPAPPATVRPSRLRRAQSVPNLKALSTTDLKAKARHTIPMPARITQSYNTAKAWSIRPVRIYSDRKVAGEPSSSVWTPTSTNTPITWLSSIAQPIARLPVRSSRPTAVGTSTALTFPQVPHQAAIVTPSHLPPINSQTLKELDLHEILKNPQLRHDLVFDSDLQFRPNFDGERGLRKRDLCNKYWRAVQREIQMQCTCTSFYGNAELPCVCVSNRRRRVSGPSADASDTTGSTPVSEAEFFTRIPALIAELRCVCLSVLPSGSARMSDACGSASASASSSAPPRLAPLTPTRTEAKRSSTRVEPSTASSSSSISAKSAARPTAATDSLTNPPFPMSDEHVLINQCLDPALIMQQLRYGALDVAELVKTLGAILKQHCAPMRDPLIDNMVNTITQHGDVTRSLRQCFEILELMKLDVANHQLSTSRIYLIETAPDFESRWLREQVSKGRLNLQRTLAWFSQHLARQQASPTAASRSAQITAAFNEGLIDLIFDAPSLSMPATAFVNPPSPSRFSSFAAHGAQNNVALAYPETFQFDAYRLLTFHGEVTDITVVSMLLLLFRQLACSHQNLSQAPLPTCDPATPATAKASALAAAQLDKVKGEIWTLLRDAELELFNQQLRSANSPPPATPGGVTGRVLDSRLSSWRKVISDLVLQIASRAIQVQIMARTGNVDATDDQLCAATAKRTPSQTTINFLTRWLETNLQSTSPLFKLCRTRLRTDLAQLTAISSAGAIAASPMRRTHAHKRSSSSLFNNPAVGSPSKRCRLDKVASCPSSSSAVMPQNRFDDGDLGPFAAEIQLLAERIRKVKTFHLTVYRPYYECMAAGQPDLTQSASSK